MCGIYSTNIPFKEEEIAAKLKSIQFRGPDNLGIVNKEGIILGHLRLAIIDLEERSNQPMSKNHLSIVYNGEVYNFKDIRQELIGLGYHFTTASDTEVILCGYEEWGVKLLPKLNGMFAFAIYDNSKKKLFSARDRLGVKPFYYYWKDGTFEICSQLRPLINPGSKISEEAVSIYLDCGYVPSPFSIIQDIFKLPPGNFMEIDLLTNTIILKEFWNIQPTVIKNISYAESKKELHELLIDAVKIRLQADVPLGTFLSGGIDSALVSSIASKISKDPIHTFTIGFEDPEYDESKIASQFSKIIGSVHTETICTPEDVINLIPKLVKVYDEPFADSSALPSLLLNSIAKKYVTVALSGDGGDESFLGYNHFDSVARYVMLNRVPKIIRKFFSKFLSLPFFKSRFRHLKDILKIDSIKDFIQAIFIGYDSLQSVRRKGWLSKYKRYMELSTSPVQQAADLNIKLWLENDSNVKVDRASMAYSVEIRSPFLDFRIIEFARNLPVHFRYEKGRRKKILRDLLKEYIPEEIFDQPKSGFRVPIGKWMRNELKSEFENNLSDNFLKKVPNLNISKFKVMFRQHLDGEVDHTISIWNLYILSKWYQEFGFY